MAETSLLETVQRFGRSGRDETKPPARFDAEHNVLWLGDVPLPFAPGQQTNAMILRAVAESIRELRRLGKSDPCYLRQADMPSYVQILNLRSKSIRRDLRKELRLNKREAGETLQALRNVAAHLNA